MSATRSRVEVELLLAYDALLCAPVRFLKKNARYICEGCFLIFFITWLTTVAMVPGITLVMVAGAAGILVAPFFAYVYANLVKFLLIFGFIAVVLSAVFVWIHWFVFPRAVASAMAYELGDTEAQPLPNVARKKNGKSLRERWDGASDTTKIMCYYMIPLYVVLAPAAFIVMGLGIVGKIDTFLDFSCPVMFVVTFVAVVHALING